MKRISGIERNAETGASVMLPNALPAVHCPSPASMAIEVSWNTPPFTLAAVRCIVPPHSTSFMKTLEILPPNSFVESPFGSGPRSLRFSSVSSCWMRFA